MRLSPTARAGSAFLLVCVSLIVAASRLVAQGPQQAWHTEYTTEFDNNRTSADVMPDGLKQFTNVWRFQIVTDPAGSLSDASISVTPTASVLPLTPSQFNATLAQTPTQFVWTNPSVAPAGQQGSNVFTDLFGTTQVVYDLGYQVNRLVSGGSQANQRVVAAGATEARIYSLTFTPTDQSLTNAGVTLFSSGLAPGQPGGVVVVNATTCAVDAGVLQSQGSNNYNWQINQGGSPQPMVLTPHTLTCSISVTNTSAADAVWMPYSIISADRAVQSISGDTSVTMTTNPGGDPPDPLGTITIAAIPNGVNPQMIFTRHFVRTTHMDGENKLPNRPPTVALVGAVSPNITFTPGPFILNEGTNTGQLSLQANASDPDNNPLSYLWQIVSSTGSLGSFIGSPSPNFRQYQNPDGPALVTLQVTVSDGQGGTASASTTVTVLNVAPTIFVPGATFTLGSVYAGCASIQDLGIVDSPWPVNVNYGDGSPAEQPAVLAGGCNGAGQAHTQLSHLFTHAGTFPISGTVTDKDGSSTSGVNTVTVNKATPIINVAAGPNPSSAGQPVTITATVAKPIGFSGLIVAPTGTVTFSGPIAVTTVPLDANGSATLVTSALPVGTPNVTMTYNGDSNYNPNTTSRNVTVNAPVKPAALITLAGPASVNYGASISFIVNINGISQAPTGSVFLSTVGSPSLVFGSRVVTTSGTTGTASFTINGLGVGPHTFQVTYNSNNPNLSGGSATASLTVNQPNSIPFSQLTPLPAGACLCTPLIMNTDVTGAEHWFAKAAGTSMNVTVYAQPVNQVDPGIVQMRVRDAAGTMVGSATATYPVGSTLPVSATAAVTTIPGGVYRVEVSTPGASLLQPHYRLKFDGALEAGLPSPSFNAFEEYQASDVPQPWLFNVASGERLQVSLSAPNIGGIPGPTSVTASLVNVSAPGIAVPLVNPADPTGPPVSTVTVSNASGIPGMSLQMASAASSSNVYALLLHNVNGHFRLSRIDAAADRGIYLSWFGSGDGSVRFNVSAGGLALPASFQVGADITHVLSGNDMGHRMLPVGVTDVDEADTGTYHLHFTVPAGFIVSPADIDVNVLCDQPLEINVSISALTTTTLTSSGGAVTGPATFTATVASPGGAPSVGVVTFYDGATILGTASVTDGVATFTTASLALGPHTITASYGGGASYLSSSSNAIQQLLYAYPGAGTFVIGDVGAAVGTSVTFWGAQWEKLNAMTGGGASASFKGYANNVSGTTWATDPGNSSNPPAGPLPSYMGVIVTSQVAKSGPGITGGITRIVVVKTDAGYDGNPGHTGTGTIVAIVP